MRIETRVCLCIVLFEAPAFIPWFGSARVTALAQLPPTPDKDAAQDIPKPQLFVEKRLQELGTVLEGDKVGVSWLLENRGGADLVIDRTAASCGCTVVKLRDEDKVIAAGGKLELKAEFNSTGRFGELNKGISVFTNDALEAELKLTMHGNVQPLYLAEPPGLVNMGVLRRGETAERTLDISPAPGRGEVTIRGIEVETGAPVIADHVPFEEKGKKGERVRFSIIDTVALGPVSASIVVRLSVGEIERERVVAVRGEIVGDLTWLPKVIDSTRQPSLPGKKLAPLTIASTDMRPFVIREVSAGPVLEVSAEPSRYGKSGIEYSVSLTVREDAPPGPFGATLRVVTDSLDQPVVEVPVYGLVSPAVEVEPPMVILRGDGTPEGIHRRLRVKTSDASALRVSAYECDNPAVRISFDEQASARYGHLRYFDVRLTGELPTGAHQAVIRLSTDAKGAARLEVPVRIEIPSKGP
ncbi:MAG: DUF1573 domain-containing protein [Phycisphaerales bacterium]|nr:DUF1573 domain-containing protein [Phycisphaerales bacterium]